METKDLPRSISEAAEAIRGAATNLESPNPQTWGESWIAKLRQAAEDIEEDERFRQAELTAIHALLDDVNVPYQHEWAATLPLLARIFHPHAADTDLAWRVRVAVEWIKIAMETGFVPATPTTEAPGE
jgi:hypothetical protein